MPQAGIEPLGAFGQPECGFGRAIGEVMRCEDVTGILLEYDGGGLPPPRRGRVEHHLEACATCAAYANTYTAVQDLVQEALAVELSQADQADLDMALQTAIRRTA